MGNIYYFRFCTMIKSICNLILHSTYIQPLPDNASCHVSLQNIVEGTKVTLLTKSVDCLPISRRSKSINLDSLADWAVKDPLRRSMVSIPAAEIARIRCIFGPLAAGRTCTTRLPILARPRVLLQKN